jgi:riboflavin-specific deaminase-like protein
VAETTVEPLFPPGPAASPRELVAAARAEWVVGADRPFTYLSMVETVDGRAGLDGRSATLGDDADTEMLLELRMCADAVLIGTGTLRAEGYDKLVRAPERRARRHSAGLPEDPSAVVISRRGDIPWDAGLFAAAGQPVLVYTGAPLEVPDVAAEVEVVRLAEPSPAAVLADLHARGVRRLLCEGGATLNAQLLRASLVDELFLTLAPLVTGDKDEPTVVAGRLPAVAHLELRWVLRHGDELLLRYALARGQ